MRISCCRQLDCKVEEIHTTLRKHLAKEEEQLLPLLLEHFTHAEQVGFAKCDILRGRLHGMITCQGVQPSHMPCSLKAMIDHN